MAADLIAEAGEYLDGDPWLLLGTVQDALGKSGPRAEKQAKRPNPALDPNPPEAGPWKQWLERAKRGELASTEAAADHVRKGGLVGIVPGVHDLAVLDVDEGDPEKLTDEYCPASVARTRRGSHLYYEAPRPAPGNQTWEAHGCRGEVRCAAGYVVVWDPAALLEPLRLAHIDCMMEFPFPPVMRSRQRETADRPQTPVAGGAVPSHTRILATLGSLDPTDYERWVHVGMALHHEFDGHEDGLEWWIRWSKGDFTGSGESPGTWDGRRPCAEKWQSFDKEGPSGGGTPITWRSVEKWARDAKRRATADNPPLGVRPNDRHADPGAEEQAAKREEALERTRELIAQHDFDQARRELDALDGEDTGPPAALEDDLEKATDAKALRRILNRVDPAGNLDVHTDWTGTPPEREWLAGQWMPTGRVTLLSAHGGAAKSLLGLQIAAVVASGEGFRAERTKRPSMLQRAPSAAGNGPLLDGDPGVVVSATWEDEADEFLRRLSWLPDTPSSLRKLIKDRFHVVDLAGAGALWGPVEHGHRDTVATLTATGVAFEAYCRRVKPRLIVIDPVAAAFGGNENDRGAVRAFLSHLNRLAAEIGAAILLIAHPPKGRDADHYSGSTDWRNGVRALWTLGPETVRGYGGPPSSPSKPRAAQGQALTLEKSNYSRAGRRAWLRFVVEPGEKGRDGPPKKMYWEECGAVDAARAYHKWKGWPEPSRKEDKPPKPSRKKDKPRKPARRSQRDLVASDGKPVA